VRDGRRGRKRKGRKRESGGEIGRRKEGEKGRRKEGEKGNREKRGRRGGGGTPLYVSDGGVEEGQCVAELVVVLGEVLDEVVHDDLTLTDAIKWIDGAVASERSGESGRELDDDPIGLCRTRRLPDEDTLVHREELIVRSRGRGRLDPLVTLPQRDLNVALCVLLCLELLGASLYDQRLREAEATALPSNPPLAACRHVGAVLVEKLDDAVDSLLKALTSRGESGRIVETWPEPMVRTLFRRSPLPARMEVGRQLSADSLVEDGGYGIRDGRDVRDVLDETRRETAVEETMRVKIVTPVHLDHVGPSACAAEDARGAALEGNGRTQRVVAKEEGHNGLEEAREEH